MKVEDIVHLQETCLTIRGSRRRTTIPGEILLHLRLKDKDKIRWVLYKDGSVSVFPVKR